MSCETPYIPPRRYLDPNNTGRYHWNFNPWLTSKGGLTIASFEIVLPVGMPLTVVSLTALAGVVSLDIFGVVDKVKYTVTCRITTSGASPLTLDRSIVLIGRSM